MEWPLDQGRHMTVESDNEKQVYEMLFQKFFIGKKACVSICSVALEKSVHLSTWGCAMGSPTVTLGSSASLSRGDPMRYMGCTHSEQKSGCSFNHNCSLTGCAADEPPQSPVLYLIYLKRLPKSWLEVVISHLLDRNQITVRSEDTEGFMSVLWEIHHSQITAGVRIFFF